MTTTYWCRVRIDEAHAARVVLARTETDALPSSPWPLTTARRWQRPRWRQWTCAVAGCRTVLPRPWLPCNELP